MRKICSTLAVLLIMVAASAVAIPVGPDVGKYAQAVAITNSVDPMNHSAAIGSATAFAVLANEAVLFGNADHHIGALANNHSTVYVDTGQANVPISGSVHFAAMAGPSTLVPEVTARSAPNHGNGAHVAAG